MHLGESRHPPKISSTTCVRPGEGPDERSIRPQPPEVLPEPVRTCRTHIQQPFATDRGRLVANVANGLSAVAKLETNVRDDAALIADFVDSVREHGVINPIVAVRGDDWKIAVLSWALLASCRSRCAGL